LRGEPIENTDERRTVRFACRKITKHRGSAFAGTGANSGPGASRRGCRRGRI
jgi:hypothetical protein